MIRSSLSYKRCIKASVVSDEQHSHIEKKQEGNQEKYYRVKQSAKIAYYLLKKFLYWFIFHSKHILLVIEFVILQIVCLWKPGGLVTK